MVDAQTEARAIARKYTTVPAEDRINLSREIAAALEAQAAELAAEHAALRLAADRADRAEAQLAEANKALEPFADIADLIDAETEGMSETDELELHYHDYLMASWPVSLFRAARRALTGGI